VVVSDPAFYRFRPTAPWLLSPGPSTNAHPYCDHLPKNGTVCKKHINGFVVLNPSEKYEGQLGSLFPIYGKIKNGPNHQPVKDRIA